jgi:nucleotide-binding universal stress UspA family protein
VRLRRRRPAEARPGAPRLLVPFSGGQLDPAVLAAALRIARADGAVFVPAYLIMVPFSLALDSPLQQEVELALPVLEAVELQAQDEGVPIDARLERGRSLRDALRRLWEVESFDRILLPVSADERTGFDERDIAWVLMNAPTETLALRPASGSVRPHPAGASAAGVRE